MYDASGRFLARMTNDRIYDAQGLFMARVDGERLYGADGRYLGRMSEVQPILAFWYFLFWAEC
jgi:type IV secretory pathway protease TraF